MLPDEFQFHKGTIRTIGFAWKKDKDNHFNSIKVQLEHNEKTGFSICDQFQFHKGTIRTSLPVVSIGIGTPISIP